MAITILEAMKLPTFKDFDLVAGYRGLDREIQRASILDYEYESSLFDKPIQTYFEKEDFVISSLIYAKDDQSLILESVKGLISDGVSGLAIKNIYYDELPEEVIKYANQMDFPIFMFDKKGSYYEDIVTEIYDKNKEKIIRAIKKFCKNLKIATSIDLSQDEIFETCLYNHINSIYKKMNLGINQYGVLPIDIRIKYPYAYELGKIAKKTIEEELGLKLDDEEISNIAVHVGGAIERSEHNQKKKVFKVIIVCVSGIGTSMLVKNKLEYLFEGKIEIVKIIPAYLIDYINVMQVDFIISTVDIKCERVPVITVSPLLNDNEVKIIEKFMKTGKMYKEVETRDLFDRNLFFTDLDFNTKEEVIEYMGSQLVNQGVIDDDMKKSFFDREKIATTEIGHMVALPHGANGKILKNKIAVGILKNPIHWTLDDVRLVLILAIDKDEIFDYEKLFSTIYKQVGSVSKVIGICENKSYEKFMKMFYFINLI